MNINDVCDVGVILMYSSMFHGELDGDNSTLECALVLGGWNEIRSCIIGGNGLYTKGFNHIILCISSVMLTWPILNLKFRREVCGMILTNYSSFQIYTELQFDFFHHVGVVWSESVRTPELY